MGLEHCRLTPRERGELVKLIVAGSTARTAADLAGVHRNTAPLFFAKLRGLTAAEQDRAMAAAFNGPVEIDESYFGGLRKGKRGRGAAGKVAVFGVLKRGGRVYAHMIADCKRDTLLPIIRRKVKPVGVVYSDTIASYDTLSVEGYEHVRINHSVALSDGTPHINGIENFWSQAKRHFRRYNGVPKALFQLFLQAFVWRFNARTPEGQLKSLWKLPAGSKASRTAANYTAPIVTIQLLGEFHAPGVPARLRDARRRRHNDLLAVVAPGHRQGRPGRPEGADQPRLVRLPR